MLHPNAGFRALIGDGDASSRPLKALVDHPLFGALVSPLEKASAARAAAEVKVGDHRARLVPVGDEGMLVLLEAVREDRAKENEQLLSMIAHDLKNPLNVVSLSAYQLATLQLPPETKERVKKQVDSIKRSTQRITDLLNDVLDLARLEYGQLMLEPEPCPVEKLVSEAMEHMPSSVSQKRITIERSLEPGLTVMCDRERTVRVIAGLIVNAAAASAEQGLVIVHAMTKGDDVVFEVRDVGNGIALADAPHLFARDLYRRRGTKARIGRGLPLAKGVVEAQKGKIWFESEPGKGSAFFFTLPRAKSQGT